MDQCAMPINVDQCAIKFPVLIQNVGIMEGLRMMFDLY